MSYVNQLSDSDWTKLLWAGVILCALAPFIFLTVRFLYRLKKPEKDDIESAVRKIKRDENLNEANAEFEKRKREREETIRKFQEKQNEKHSLTKK
jgi:hypothetical protein